MKPLRIFIFLATVALYLVLLALIFPRQGISVSPGIRLKFMDLSDLRRSEVSKEKVVEQLLATATVSEDPEAEFQLPLEETIPAVTTGSGSSGSNVPAVPDPGYGISGTDTLIQVAPANADSLTEIVLSSAGVTPNIPLAVAGLQDVPAFREPILEDGAELRVEQVEQEMVALVRNLLHDYPDIGSFVLECHNLAPYGRAVQAATGKPVFDIIDFATWIYGTVEKRAFPRHG